MILLFQKIPVQGSLLRPFLLLGKFLAHEQKLLSRMDHHIAKGGPQVRHLLLFVSRHLIQERAFPVDYLVMRQAQQEFLTVGIDHAEGQLVMGAASVDRILLHIIDKVVHPAHVPLIVKAQAVVLHLARDLRPGCGFLCDQESVGMFFLKDRIQVLQELDGFQIFISPIDIGYPFSIIFSVIQVKHGSHGVHTDSIRMILLRPEQRIGDQEILYLRTSVIVDQGSPVGMHPLPWIQMLVQAGAVKVGESECILGEMGRYPVQDHPDPLLMHIVHEIHKVLTASVAAGRRIVSGHLVSPGLVQRMFHNRHQFHMGIAHVFYIVSQKGSDLSVIIKKPPFFFRFSPGAQVHFVHSQRLLFVVKVFSGLHPVSVTPLIFLQVCNNGSCLRPKLRFISIRVRFQIDQGALCLDLIFVQSACLDSRDKQFINAGDIQAVHLMAPSVPMVKIAHYTDPHGVGRPHGKINAGYPMDRHGMCA